MNKILFLVMFVCAFGIALGKAEKEEKGTNLTCSDLGEYDRVNITALQGQWKAKELVFHLSERNYVRKYRSCPRIDITIVDNENADAKEIPENELLTADALQYYHSAVSQMEWYCQYRRLRLLWDEDGFHLEYMLFFKNDSIGIWNSFGDQNGPLAVGREYRQFTGTVQVLKEFGDNMLLLFCQEPLEYRSAQLFSILLTRDPVKLQRWEIESAHYLLRSKNLSVSSRSLLCGTSENLLASATLVFAAIVTLILQ